MHPFLDVKVQPVYGDFRALITWKVVPELEKSTFTVFKSPDGLNDWQIVDTGIAIDHVVDPNLVSQGKLLEHYYRVVLTGNDRDFNSPVVGTFGTVSREEFGAARRIMEMEYQAIRDFTKVHVCKLKVLSPPCKRCVDPDTDQAVGTSRCPECFGTTKEGGFFPPVVTFMRIMNISPMVKQDSPEGAGTTNPSFIIARMLAFPLLRKDDLLVHKEADRRYLVESTEYSYFGGKIPILANVKMTHLSATDIRYTFPI